MVEEYSEKNNVMEERDNDLLSNDSNELNYPNAATEDIYNHNNSINPPSAQHLRDRYQQLPSESEREDENKVQSEEQQKQLLEEMKSERVIKKPPGAKKKLKKIYSSKSFLLLLEPFLHPVSSTNYQKNMRAIKKAEKELNKDKEKHLKLEAEYDESFKSLGYKKQLTYLKEENAQLREELKLFNGTIGKLVESLNTCNSL